MARGKFQAKKDGTGGLPGEVKQMRLGSPPGAASVWLGAPTSPNSASKPSTVRAGSQAGLPALGVAVMSPWGWRILAVFAMVATGLCLTFFVDGKTMFASLWVVVSLAWGGFSFKLWREHLSWDSLASDPTAPTKESSAKRAGLAGAQPR